MNKRYMKNIISILFAGVLIFSLIVVNMPAQALTDRAGDEETLSVIVTLKAQADLSNILDRNRSTRIGRVETALQNMANATQNRIRALIASRQFEGKVSNVEYYWVFNGLAVTATADVVQELAALPEVRSIIPDETIQAPAMSESLSPAETNLNVINAPDLWQLGYQGQGIVVANMDTGVYLNHTDLAAKWRGGANSWFDPNGEHILTPTDYNGHGTWTMGVMVGGDASGTTVGVAPAAQWIAVKIFNDAGSATTSGIHSGFQWLLDPDGNPATDDAPHVVNNSWTYQGPGCILEFELDLQSLRAAGILPVFAAGNYGPVAGTSASPSNNPSAFAVGGTDDADFIYSSSSRGPSGCGQVQSIFPKLVAPGVNIHTTDLYNLYTDATGTSLAAPHVSGGLALLLNAFPGLLAGEQETALLNSAVDLGVTGPDNNFGYGRLDLAAAYQWLLDNPTPDPVNIALNRPVTVSSFQDNAHSGERAVDGNLATYWQSKQIKGKGGGPSTEWITVDLGGNASIDQIILEWDTYYATNYSIKFSGDGVSWTTVFGTSSGNGGNDAINLGIGSARYVRMESTAWNNAKLRNWLREFEIYGSAPSPSPTQTPSPGGGSVHVGDLDGSSRSRGGGRWDAFVLIAIHDWDEIPISGATVSGSWSSGGSGSCVTDDWGQCSLTRNNLKGNQQSVLFSVDDVSHPSNLYQPEDNHDMDGGSNGTSITILRP